MLVEILIIIGIGAVHKVCNIFADTNEADKNGVYRDRNGNLRLKYNKHLVADTYNEYGEKIIRNVNNGKTEINLDKIEADKRRINAIKNNNEFYLYLPDRGNTGQSHRLGNDNIKGDRYKKVNADEFYVIRRINYTPYKNDTQPIVRYYTGEYYMDMNYNICCPTQKTLANDRTIYGDKHCEIIKFITDKANRQILCAINNNLIPTASYDITINLDGAINAKYKRAVTYLKQRN